MTFTHTLYSLPFVDIPVAVGDVITLDSYLGSGLKDGETELPEDSKPGRPDPQPDLQDAS